MTDFSREASGASPANKDPNEPVAGRAAPPGAGSQYKKVIPAANSALIAAEAADADALMERVAMALRDVAHIREPQASHMHSAVTVSDARLVLAALRRAASPASGARHTVVVTMELWGELQSRASRLDGALRETAHSCFGGKLCWCKHLAHDPVNYPSGTIRHSPACREIRSLIAPETGDETQET